MNEGKRGIKTKTREERDAVSLFLSLPLSIAEMNNSVQACIVGRAHVQSRMYTDSRGVPGMKLLDVVAETSIIHMFNTIALL